MISLSPNKTEIMFMIFFGIKHCLTIADGAKCEMILLGSLEAILTSICIVSGYSMFM